VVTPSGGSRGATGLRWLAAFVLALAGPAATPAQPVAVFELDDYLDPRLLGARVTEEDKIEPGNRFLVTELITGAISDFEHQGLYSEGRTEFAHLAAKLYSGRRQFNVLATVFDPRFSPRFGRERNEAPGAIPSAERARVIPDERIRLQYGWYSFNPGTSEDGFIDRFLLSAGAARTAAGDRIYDLGLVVDLPMSFDDKNLLGSLGYDWRIVDGGFNQHRILYFYRWGNDAVFDRFGGPFSPISLPVRLSFGGERSENHWRMAPLRLELGVEVPIEILRTTLHLTYAPSFRLGSQGFQQELNHELAAFLEVIPLSRVFASTRARQGGSPNRN
jgi:hypothetical protein